MLNAALKHICALLLLAGLVVGGAMAADNPTGLTEREEVRERIWGEADAEGQAPGGENPAVSHEAANWPAPQAAPARPVIPVCTCPATSLFTHCNSPRSPPAKARHA